MPEAGMVMTVLEAKVPAAAWSRLIEAYTERSKHLPPGLLQSFLVRSRSENTLWRIVSVWESQEALEQMRRTTETPGGVLIFRAAGAEPNLTVYGVERHVRG